MIAYGLRETGHDPAWIVGGVVPAARRQRRRRLRVARRRGRRVGPLGVRAPAAARGRDERRARPSRGVRLDGRARRVRSRRGSRACPRSSVAGSSSRRRSRSPCPASTTAGTPPRRSQALVRVGVERADARSRRSRRSTGADRRFEVVGARGGVTVIDDYGHNPTELRAALDTARGRTDGRLVAALRPARRRADATPPPRARRGARSRRRRDRHGLRRVDATRRARVSPAGSSSTRFPTRRGGSGRRRSTTPRGSRSTSSGRATSS